MSQNLLLVHRGGNSGAAVRDAFRHLPGNALQVEWATSCAQALDRLPLPGGPHRQASFGAVLVDLFLPDSQGLATFDLLHARTGPLPLLILAAPEDEPLARLAVERGARDYFLKSRLDSSWLAKSVAGLLDREMHTAALMAEKDGAFGMLNAISEAVIWTDLEGRVTYLNSTAERLTGWPRASATGRPIEEVFQPLDADPVHAKSLNRAAPCRLLQQGCLECTIETQATPLRDRNGEVVGTIRVFHDVSAERSLTQAMSRLVQYDSLTDLPNRVLLNARLAEAIEVAHRGAQRFALLYLDLDRFKHVNDALGHSIGDRLLQSIALRLRTCVAASDTVSRQGGDEFVLLFLHVAQAQDAAVCAEKILQAMSTSHHIEHHDLHITPSIGIVLYPDDGKEPETLLRNADLAMYQAKESGRNTFQFYKATLNSRSTERQVIESGLRRALLRGEFELHYQPKINLRSGKIAAVEALLRWRHPERGLLAPAHFIEIAEESGLIVPIGQWVLREGCRQAQDWHEAGLPPVRLAVNVSTAELRAKDYVAGVRTIVEETGFDPRRLELELTETFLIQDSNSTAVVLQALKDQGIHLALDDFGTGYSSLSYIRRFPIDTLKVDQSFIRNVATDAASAGVVVAVIAMGKSLRMRVIAEGVETREQLDFLAKHRCPEAQGYYFSRPIAAREFATLLQIGPRHEAGGALARRAG